MVAAEIESQPPTANSDYANELEAMRARMIELQEQVARKTAAARILDAHMKTLAGQAASAQERIADLEIELGSTQEALAQQENENCSLQSSLDLMVAENARLSRRLLEECTACDTVSSRLERVNSTLTATDAERDKLIAAVAEADKKRQSETEDLQTRLKAAVSATLARNLAENEFKSLQASLQTKEQEVLETATVALEADGRLERIAAELQGTRDRIGGCERENPSSERPPDGGGNESLQRPARTQPLQFLPDGDFMRPPSAAAIGIKAEAMSGQRGRETNGPAGGGARPSAQAAPTSTALLAGTITF